MVSIEYGKGKENLLLKNEEISGGKAHTNTRKQTYLKYFDNHRCFFLDQKRVNVCEHTVKMASHESEKTLT